MYFPVYVCPRFVYLCIFPVYVCSRFVYLCIFPVYGCSRFVYLCIFLSMSVLGLYIYIFSLSMASRFPLSIGVNLHWWYECGRARKVPHQLLTPLLSAIKMCLSLYLQERRV